MWEAGLASRNNEEEVMQVVHIPLDDVPGLITAGELTDAKSIIGLLLARERLARR